MTPRTVTARVPARTGIAKREDDTVTRGAAAKEAITDRLRRWPEAVELASRVADFYGDLLEYRETETAGWSQYEIKLELEPAGLLYARIQLQLATPRVAEALVHELLHLNLAVSGYPVGAKIWMPLATARHAPCLLGIYPRITNLVEHELTIERFLNLGFDKSNFLGCLCPAPDYREVASRALHRLGYVEEIGFPWWCLEYFRHWVSSRHGGGDRSAMDAENAFRWASRVHPDFPEAITQILRIFESGAIRERRAYPRHVNSILKQMKLPGFAEWVRLQDRGRVGPVVGSWSD